MSDNLDKVIDGVEVSILRQTVGPAQRAPAGARDRPDTVLIFDEAAMSARREKAKRFASELAMVRKTERSRPFVIGHDIEEVDGR